MTRRYRVYVIGDSHIEVLKHLRGIETFVLPGRSMYAVARDKGAFFDEFANAMREPAPVIVMFGTKDVRHYIGRIADTEGRSRQEIIEHLVEAYLSVLSAKISPARPIIVASVLPGRRDDDVPLEGPDVDYGLEDDRAALGRELNRQLAAGCDRYGFYFLDHFDVYATPEGFLRPELSDGGFHVGEHAEALIDPKAEEALAWARDQIARRR